MASMQKPADEEEEPLTPLGAWVADFNQLGELKM